MPKEYSSWKGSSNGAFKISQGTCGFSLRFHVGQPEVDQAPLFIKDIEETHLSEAIGFADYLQVLFRRINHASLQDFQRAHSSFPSSIGCFNLLRDRAHQVLAPETLLYLTRLCGLGRSSNAIPREERN